MSTNNKGRNPSKDATPKTTSTSDFTPAMPTPGTQPARLLAALQSGATVNPLQGWFRLGIYRLADTAYQLRRMGWPVITDLIDVPNRFGEVCHVARYRLEVKP